MSTAYTSAAPTTKYFGDVEAQLPRLDGQTVAITGTTSGTGRVVALCAAKLGAKVLMLNRPSARADAALAKLKEEVPEAADRVAAVECDLMSLDAVRAAAAKVKEAVGDQGLDGLGLNAGVMALPDKATSDGYDVQMQTNHISHFLLTKELWPALEKAAALRGDARVVTMTSEAHKGSPADANYYGKNGGSLGGDEIPESGFGGGRWVRYHQSKLANCLFTYALHDKIAAKGSKVKAMLAHPGLSATSLQATTDATGGMPASFADVFTSVAMSPEDGAAGFVKCLCGSKGFASGVFLGPVENRGFSGPPVEITPEEICTDEEAKNMLWEESCKAVGDFEL